MNPINAKALLDLAVTVIATITSEVLDKRSATKRKAATQRDATNHSATQRDAAILEGRNDRPS